MGTKYTTTSATGLNNNPPSDDGQQIPANEIEWAKHIDQIATPINNRVSSINDKLVTHFDVGPTLKTADYSVVSSDFNRIIRVTGSGITITITSGLGAGFSTVIKNDDALNNITIAASGGETIEGNSSIVLAPDQYAVLYCDETTTNYTILSNNNQVVTVNSIPATDRPILSINAVDSLNDLDVTTGKIISDDGTTVITIGTAITKRLDDTWVSGTNQGGTPSAIEPLSIGVARSTLHIFAIGTPAGVGEIGWDTSVTAANLMVDANVVAGGYTKKRRIASLLLDASDNWIPFVQYGDEFLVEAYRYVNSQVAVSPSFTTIDTGCPHNIDGLSVIIGGALTFSSSGTISIALSDDNSIERNYARGTAGNSVIIPQIYFPVNVDGEVSLQSTGVQTVNQYDLFGWIDKLDLA